MECWNNYFSGASLNETSFFEKLQNKWWERMAKKPHSPWNHHLEAPDCVIEGDLKDTTGNQGTVMCLEAINWWKNVGQQGTFSRLGINYAMLSGQWLHHRMLRKQLKLGGKQDPIFRMPDMPDVLTLRYANSFRQPQWEANVKLGPSFNTRDKDYLSDFLLSFADAPFAAVVTIGNHSISVMFNKDKKWQVFDPNGSIKFLGRKLKNASCCVFENVDAAIAFLMKTQNANGKCHVAVPHIIGRTTVYEEDVNKDNSSSPDTFTAETFALYPNKSENTDNTDDEDPFISMMGGFGGY